MTSFPSIQVRSFGNAQDVWPCTSRYFDREIMSASQLHRIFQKTTPDIGGILAYLEVRNGIPRQLETDFKQNLSLSTSENQQAFQRQVEREKPEYQILHILNEENFITDYGRGAGENIAIEKYSWLWLLNSIPIHPHFVDMFYHTKWTGSFVTATTFANAGTAADGFHIMIKYPASGFIEAAIYFRFDLTTKQSTWLLITNDRQTHQTNLLELFSAPQPQHITNPFSVFVILVAQYSQFLNQDLSTLSDKTSKMEVTSGRGSFAYQNRILPSPDRFDLKGMHHTAANLRVAVYAVEFQAKLISFLQTAHLSYLSLKEGHAARTADLTVTARAIHDAFQMHMTISEQRAHNSRFIALERAHTQLNIADCMLNQQVAEATRRDSSAMKTIASLTMAYLPATFVAAIFSTVFFRAEQESGELAMNPQIWIYVVAAATLTVVTFTV